jgi:hypothetical protein
VLIREILGAGRVIAVKKDGFLFISTKEILLQPCAQ